MVNHKIFSLIAVLAITACSSSEHADLDLEKRSIEKLCLDLEHRWDKAQRALIDSENRQASSWLYHVTDSFNPLTNNSDKNFEIAKRQEQRARENYFSTGCTELNKMQIKSAYTFKDSDVKVDETKSPIKENLEEVKQQDYKNYSSYNPNFGYSY